MALVAAAAAHANVGIPLLGSYAIYQIGLLLPVVIIEAAVFRNALRVPVWRAGWAAVLVNVISTLVGACIVLATFFFDLGTAPGTSTDVFTLIILYPFYRLSILIENATARWPLGSIDRHKIRAAVVFANRGSYFMLAVFILARIVKSRIVNGYFI
ncbi:MAG: hypothetical protein HKO62_09200 [Gammaproteobacteria bacterium]|nr:hypothetical protein [Gammaproteobacteria bacterium]